MTLSHRISVLYDRRLAQLKNFLSVDRINLLYSRGVTHLKNSLFGDPLQFSNSLIPELTSYFLSDAIEARVTIRSKSEKGREEKVREEVVLAYEKRVEEAVSRELKQQSYHSVEKNLLNCALPVKLSDELLSSTDRFMRVLRTRNVFVPEPLSAWDAQQVFGILMRALQQVTLDIIRVDYPSKVPENAVKSIRQVLLRINKASETYQCGEKIKCAARAEAELRVLEARARRGASLPVRPIPTAPLASDDLEKHYKARPDRDALKLARQIRHADGTILVTGYRGVGKSSFVNRVIFHAISAQRDNPTDGWLLVPITVNLAKVAGVQNILRLTLRATREALVDSETRKARPIPAPNSSKLKEVPLPLHEEREILRLEEAYMRATYKVSMSRTNNSENRWEASTSISLDPGRIFGKAVGVELGKFLEAGVKKSRSERINRELSLLDYDENAAEEDLAQLIRNLARKRPLYGKAGPEVQIKLVFIFDELDKMDTEKGLKPMIEGLKNLFLQQYSVFLLVTSKSFYYELLKKRAVEDAMINSYFSAIVNVPLLTFPEANRLVADWVDVEATEKLKPLEPEENDLIEKLTRFLLYKSSGNPRDIIRELRLMQEWAKEADQPYLTDKLAESPALQIFATIQECIEQVAIPKQSSPATSTESDGSVTLVADGLVGKEAKAEQIRHGLYTLVEEIIALRRLELEPTIENGQSSQPSTLTPGSSTDVVDFFKRMMKPQRDTSELSPFIRIYKDNFSLFSVEEVRDYARRLGMKLSERLNSLSFGQDGPTTLFMMDGTNVLRFEQPFFELAERQSLEPTADRAVETSSTADLVSDAEDLIIRGDWASKLEAINLIGRLGEAEPPDVLKEFLWNIVETDLDPSHRLAAAGVIKGGMFQTDKPNRIKLIEKEKDESVLLRLIPLLKTDDTDSRKVATDTILRLIKEGTGPTRRVSDSVAIEALNVLAEVVDRDVSVKFLSWLSSFAQTELVQREAVKTLKALQTNYSVDIASIIIAYPDFLRFFAGSPTSSQPEAKGESTLPVAEAVLKNYLRELLRSDPLRYAKELLGKNWIIDVTDLLSYIWNFAYDRSIEGLAELIFDEMLVSEDKGSYNSIDPKRKYLLTSLRNTVEFQIRLLPYLNRQLVEFADQRKYTTEQAEALHLILTELESNPNEEPA